MKTEFATVTDLVRYIHEQSDEVKKAILIPPGFAYVDRGVELLPPVDVFTLVLYVANGDPIVLRDDPVEAILNNGILNRRHIRIELWTAPTAELEAEPVAVSLPPPPPAVPVPRTITLAATPAPRSPQLVSPSTKEMARPGR